MRLVFGYDQAVAEWVKDHIPHMRTGFDKCVALGVASESGEALAGVVFHDYQPNYSTVQMSVAAVSPRWATRRISGQIFRYPFIDLGVNRAWAATEHTNARCIKFNKGIGFVQECVMRDQFGPKRHAVVFRMLKADFARHYPEFANG